MHFLRPFTALCLLFLSPPPLLTRAYCMGASFSPGWDSLHGFTASAQQSPQLVGCSAVAVLKFLIMFLMKNPTFSFCFGSSKACSHSCTGVMNKTDPNSYPHGVYIPVLPVHWALTLAVVTLLSICLLTCHPSWTVSSLRADAIPHHYLQHILCCLAPCIY